MTTRLYITLEPELMNAIDELAIREYRDTRSQIRVMLVRELQKLGLLDETFEDNPEQPKKENNYEKANY